MGGWGGEFWSLTHEKSNPSYSTYTFVCSGIESMGVIEGGRSLTSV